MACDAGGEAVAAVEANPETGAAHPCGTGRTGP